MSLEGVLKAVKSLIMNLEPSVIPASLSERRDFYLSVFDSLTSDEIEDLAKIEPARLKLYTDSIYAGQLNLIRNRLPISFSLLKRAHKKLGAKLDPFDLIRNREQVAPWQTAATVDLLLAFIQFINREKKDFVAVEPLLPDCMQFELACFQLRREVDSTSLKKCLSIEDVISLSLEQLLQLQFIAPLAARIIKSPFDLPVIKSDYNRIGKLADNYEKQGSEVTFIGARGADLGIRWIPIDNKLAELYSQLPRGRPTPISFLANRFTDQVSSTPEEMAGRFAKFLLDLNSIGAVCILNDEVH